MGRRIATIVMCVSTIDIWTWRRRMWIELLSSCDWCTLWMAPTGPTHCALDNITNICVNNGWHQLATIRWMDCRRRRWWWRRRRWRWWHSIICVNICVNRYTRRSLVIVARHCCILFFWCTAHFEDNFHVICRTPSTYTTMQIIFRRCSYKMRNKIFKLKSIYNLQFVNATENIKKHIQMK